MWACRQVQSEVGPQTWQLNPACAAHSLLLCHAGQSLHAYGLSSIALPPPCCCLLLHVALPCTLLQVMHQSCTAISDTSTAQNSNAAVEALALRECFMPHSLFAPCTLPLMHNHNSASFYISSLCDLTAELTCSLAVHLASQWESMAEDEIMAAVS